MKQKKYEIRDQKVIAKKDIERGENIVSLGLDIDYLLDKLKIKERPIPDVIHNIYPASRSNAETIRNEAGMWYLVATREIAQGRSILLTMDKATYPWWLTQ